MAIKPPIIAGKYTLLRKLGAGGMAEVFLAKQMGAIDGGGGFEKLVVIKRILPHLATGAGNSDFLAMFLDEARLASDLRHPNIVNVIDVGKTDTTYFIVMEFLHGQDVRKVQRKNAAFGEMVPFGHACQIAVETASALHYAHTKKDLSGKPLSIVHRDVSPQNIVVTYEGGTKILDFGIAKAASQSTQTQVGVLKGKYTYMSPEQALGEQVDARTDQFALGIVLWELLTMRRLFKRDTEMMTLEAITNGQIPRPSRFRTDTPPVLDDIVMKALSRDRKNRFADCQELAVALEDACAKSGIVCSSQRLSQYMRRLFADSLAEEATLGLVNPDGSLTANLTPFTLPPPENEEKPAPKEPERPPEPEQKPAAEERTTADRPPPKSTPAAEKPNDLNAPTIAEPFVVDKPGRTALEPRRNVSATDPTRVSELGRNTDSRSLRPRPSKPARTFEPKPIKTRAPGSAPKPRASRRAQRGSRVVVGVLATLVIAAVFVAAMFVRAYVLSGPGTLVVRSLPSGAHVFLDGVDVQQNTPALLHDVVAGTPHKLRIEAPGFQPYDDIVAVRRRGETVEVKVDLKPLPAPTTPPPR